MTGHESGIDLRRDDGTLDVSLNWIARNGEVHFTIEVNSTFGLSKTVVDFTSEQAHEIAGAFREAGRQAGEPTLGVIPASVAEVADRAARDRWTAQSVGHVLGEDGLVGPESPGVVNPERSVPNAHVPYLPKGHVLGERD